MSNGNNRSSRLFDYLSPTDDDEIMTLLVALVGTDGIVVAADSRGTFGDPRGVTAQNDTMQKAYVLTPHVAVLMAGTAEVGAMIITETKKRLQASPVDDAVTPVMNVLRATSIDCYNNWFPTVPAVQPAQAVQAGQAAARPDLVFVVAGYDESNTAQLFTLASGFGFPPMQTTHGFCLQGVAQYALYLLNGLYEPNRTTDELAALAVYAITETAGQDGKVGGPVNVITIAPGDGGCQPLSVEQVNEINSRNTSRLQALRDSFYDRTN